MFRYTQLRSRFFLLATFLFSLYCLNFSLPFSFFRVILLSPLFLYVILLFIYLFFSSSSLCYPGLLFPARNRGLASSFLSFFSHFTLFLVPLPSSPLSLILSLPPLFSSPLPTPFSSSHIMLLGRVYLRERLVYLHQVQPVCGSPPPPPRSRSRFPLPVYDW